MSEGKKHDNSKADLGLIPLCALEECAKAFMLGEKKYGRFNFTEGIEVNRLLAATLRHVNQAIWESEIDLEGQTMHLGNAMASLSMAIFTIKNHPHLDNRYIKYKEQNKKSV